MSNLRISVDDGKYTFVTPEDNRGIDVLRYGRAWVNIEKGSNAVMALMFKVEELEKENKRLNAIRKLAGILLQWDENELKLIGHRKFHRELKTACDYDGSIRENALKEATRKLSEEIDTMKEFNIWSEGYAATGQQSGATFHGVFKASSFLDAVKMWADTLEPASKNLMNLDADPPTFWACELFDNETDAREAFG